MTKKDWRKDRTLRNVDRAIAQNKYSLNDLVEGSGKPAWSHQLRQFINPSQARRINPNSDEGRTIAARYLGDKP